MKNQAGKKMETQASKKIGLFTATIIGMNAMIGAGIFTAPAAMASYVGPAGILAYLFVIIAVWFMALSLSRLAALFPQEGSFYTYAKQWGGHKAGIIASAAYTVGLLVAMGLLSQAAGFYLHALFPSYTPHTLGFITLILLVLLNMFGVALSQVGQQILIVCTLFPLITTTILCLFKADINNLFPFAPYGFINVFKATRFVIFGFFGFECAASLFSIVRDPERNVPRALTYSIVLVGIIYTLFVTALILSIPLEYFTDPRIPLSETLQVVFPHNTAIFSAIHIATLSAIIGTIHSMIWSLSLLLISLIKKIQNNTLTALFSPLTNKQQLSIIIPFIGLSIFISFSTIDNVNLFFSFTATSIVFAYLMSMASLLTIANEWHSGRNYITIMGMLTASTILFFALEEIVQEFWKII